MGIPVKYHHHEVGGPGQCEIETPMISLMHAGDYTQIVKYVTKMAAHRKGQTATFMPKPLYGEAGNGLHFHQHLFKKGVNQFYDEAGYAHLSRTALYYIGGLLQHGAAILAFTNPSTNSYRRLVSGFEAPVNAFFSLGNRSAAIRVPKYADQPETTRIEFRPPDATCNIYLALAAQLMAGLDGIQRSSIRPSSATARSMKTSSTGVRKKGKASSRFPHLFEKRSKRWKKTTNSCCTAASSMNNRSRNGSR